MHALKVLMLAVMLAATSAQAALVGELATGDATVLASRLEGRGDGLRTLVLVTDGALTSWQLDAALAARAEFFGGVQLTRVGQHATADGLVYAIVLPPHANAKGNPPGGKGNPGGPNPGGGNPGGGNPPGGKGNPGGPNPGGGNPGGGNPPGGNPGN